jgi:GGDEF domain-containing protein
MHHIVRNLWLGNQQDADKLIRKNPENITAILNVRGPDAYYPPGRDQSSEHPGKAYKYIPAPDTGFLAPKHVKEALLWLQEQTAQGARILIHCKHGISRSAGFLAAFMVQSGVAADFEAAKAAIAKHRPVQPAIPVVEHRKPAVLISPITGLPNLQAFNESADAPFGAIADVDLMKTFNNHFGPIAGDALLRRLGKILITVGVDAYHHQGDEFLCKGNSPEALEEKLSRARQLFREPFQLYAEGRIQTIEEADFSFGIGATPQRQRAALSEARKANTRNESPEWLRKIIGTGGMGPNW